MFEALSAVSAEPLPDTLVNAPVVPDTLPLVMLPVTPSDVNDALVALIVSASNPPTTRLP